MKKRIISWGLILSLPITILLLVLYKSHEVDVFSCLAFNYVPSSNYSESKMYMSINNDEFVKQVEAASYHAQQQPDLVQQLVDSFEYEYKQEDVIIHVTLKCDEKIRKKLKIHFLSYEGKYDTIIP